MFLGGAIKGILGSLGDLLGGIRGGFLVMLREFLGVIRGLFGGIFGVE